MSENQADRVRLHLGCGRDVRPGWINVDATDYPGVDVVFDLDRCGDERLPFEDGSVDEIQASHLLECLQRPLPLMEELYRVAKPGTTCTFNVHYGSSDDAFTHPGHTRSYFLSSFGCFAQPYYARADFGYRGDWQPEFVLLQVPAQRFAGKPPEEILKAVHKERNTVIQMTAVLTAVKPMREQKAELERDAHVEFQLVEMAVPA